MAKNAPLAPLPANAVLPYLFAGNATFTVLNTATQGRFTFKVQVAKDKATGKALDFPWFVKVLTGSNNESDYRYLGVIFSAPEGQPRTLKLTGKSFATPDTPCAKAFSWVLDRLQGKGLPPTVEVWHSGHCGRCGKTLTVPESIERGIGPDCAAIMGVAL